MKKLVVLILLVLVTISHGQNITLRDTTNEFDYVIITLPEFEQTCLEFKQHKESYNNFSVLITTKQNILAEFNDSTQVQENIRDFISYAATFWQSPTPKYFLFAGDVDRIPNFEFKSIVLTSNNDSSKSDFYYAINKYDSTEEVSLYIGRVASRNGVELNNYFNKVIFYENNTSILPWQNNTLFVADDHYAPTVYNGDVFEVIISRLADELPNYINSKLYFENDSSLFYGTTDSIVNYINNVGVSSVYFCGHGSRNIFTHDSLFTLNDVESLSNNPKHFFFGSLYGQKFSTLDSTSILDQIASNEDEEIEIPNTFVLEQNYPNPFNPTTTISFFIPKEGHVTLEVYDIIGNRISVLINERKSQGSHRVDFDGGNLSSGIYFLNTL